MPQNLSRAEIALLQCGRWTVTCHRTGHRDDPPASQEGAGRTVYRFGDGPEVTAEALREHGIEVNNSEIILLNQYIHLHKHPPKGIHATGYVRKEGEPVDRERVKTLLAYVLASNMLTEAERGAVRETIEQELAATS